METITDAQWDFYQENGYVILGQVLDPDGLAALQRRIDDIMLHRAAVDYDRLMMQLDGTAEQTLGSKGATLEYRKIQNLEHDPVFMEFLTRQLFRAACHRVYGALPISCYRAMFMNKPAGKGTFLQWHQDHWTHLDRDPLLSVWTALDPATIGNGCVQIIPGSHKYGLINPDAPSGFLTDEQVEKHCAKEKVVYL